MAILEGIKSIFKSIIDYRKEKKEEKEVFNMQAVGRPMVKTNFMEHPYMQKPMQQMGLDKIPKLGTSQFGNVNKK